MKSNIGEIKTSSSPPKARVTIFPSTCILSMNAKSRDNALVAAEQRYWEVAWDCGCSDEAASAWVTSLMSHLQEQIERIRERQDYDGGGSVDGLRTECRGGSGNPENASRNVAERIIDSTSRHTYWRATVSPHAIRFCRLGTCWRAGASHPVHGRNGQLRGRPECRR
jgi:hypothetical protein